MHIFTKHDIAKAFHITTELLMTSLNLTRLECQVGTAGSYSERVWQEETLANYSFERLAWKSLVNA